MKNEGIFSLLRNRLAARREYEALAAMNERELLDLGLAPDDVTAVMDGSYVADATRRPRIPQSASAPIASRQRQTPALRSAA